MAERSEGRCYGMDDNRTMTSGQEEMGDSLRNLPHRTGRRQGKGETLVAVSLTCKTLRRG